VNLRKYLIYSLLWLGAGDIKKCLGRIRDYQAAGADDQKACTRRLLEKLLLHAWRNVPYYNRILPEAEVIVDGRVRLENFTRIPILTKQIITEQGSGLYSRDYRRRKPYENTSGGSTGRPVRLIQDRRYNAWNIATKIHFNEVLGKDLSEREIKFWGSDRDILEGTIGLKERLINFLYNRRFFNSYELNERTLGELVKLNNTFRPKAYWSYMESALELARYLSGTGVEFHPPDILISTIGPLTDRIRDEIQAGMKCRVYNQYGSREVGVVACQCRQQGGLHTFPWFNYVEVLDENGNVCHGAPGNLTVTTLRNYSMPLIRYDIGDVGIAGGSDCPCGLKTPLLEKVIGRTLGYFKKADGSLVHSHFIVQALFFKDWIRTFQVIQQDVDLVEIDIQLKSGRKAPDADLAEITEKTKMLMGPSCRVEFRFVDNIERSPSGKYLYTMSKVK